MTKEQRKAATDIFVADMIAQGLMTEKDRALVALAMTHAWLVEVSHEYDKAKQNTDRALQNAGAMGVTGR